MPISRRYTAKDLWREAARDVTGNSPDISVMNVERFAVINRVVLEVVGMFFALMKNEYLTPQVLVVDNTGDFNTASGSYTAATRTLAATMDAGFASTDVGKFIVFRDATSIYSGFIQTIISAGSVTLAESMNLPAVNIATVVQIMMIHSVPDTDEIDISTLNIFKSGAAQVTIILVSTATRDVYAVDMDELNDFRPTAEKNLTKIVFHVSNDKVRMKKGVSSYGTLLLYYPRIPIAVTADTEYVDLPDGAPMTLAIMLVKRIIAQRTGLKGFYNPADMQALVYDIYRQYDTIVSTEEIKDKVKALS